MKDIFLKAIADFGLTGTENVKICALSELYELIEKYNPELLKMDGLEIIRASDFKSCGSEPALRCGCHHGSFCFWDAAGSKYYNSDFIEVAEQLDSIISAAQESFAPGLLTFVPISANLEVFTKGLIALSRVENKTRSYYSDYSTETAAERLVVESGYSFVEYNDSVEASRQFGKIRNDAVESNKMAILVTSQATYACETNSDYVYTAWCVGGKVYLSANKIRGTDPRLLPGDLIGLGLYSAIPSGSHNRTLTKYPQR